MNMANCSNEKKVYWLSILGGMGSGLVSGMLIWTMENFQETQILFLFTMFAYLVVVFYASTQLTGC